MHQSTFFILSQGEDLLAGLFLCKEQRQQGIFFYVHTHTCATGWLSAHQCTQPPIFNKRTSAGTVAVATTRCCPLVLSLQPRAVPLFVSNRLRRFVAMLPDGQTTAMLGLSGGWRPCVTLDTATRFTTVAALSLLLLLASGGGQGGVSRRRGSGEAVRGGKRAVRLLHRGSWSARALVAAGVVPARTGRAPSPAGSLRRDKWDTPSRALGCHV